MDKLDYIDAFPLKLSPEQLPKAVIGHSRLDVTPR